MKVEIESTSKIVELKWEGQTDAVPARIWEGQTARGTPVLMFVTRVMCADTSPEANAEFEEELKETRAPSPVAAVIPLALIL